VRMGAAHKIVIGQLGQCIAFFRQGVQRKLEATAQTSHRLGHRFGLKAPSRGLLPGLELSWWRFGASLKGRGAP
jgi:hypothetical protein